MAALLSFASFAGWEIGLVILGAIWTPLVAAGFFVLRRQRESDRHEYEMQRMLEDSREYRGRREERSVVEAARRLETFVPELLESLPRRVADSVDMKVFAEFERLQALAVQQQAESAPARALGSDHEDLLREISHALNTPLSQAEAAAVSALDQLEADGANPVLRRQLSQVPISVTMCKAFIFAFRLLAAGETTSDHGSAVALEPAIRAAAGLYLTREQRIANVTVTGSEEIPGYDSSYILATVLPLIENAVECVPSDGEIQVVQEGSSEATSISVSNPIEGDLPEDIYQPGLSTKPGHDGLGLAMVRRLLQGAGGELGHVVDDGLVTFTVTFPAHEA